MMSSRHVISAQANLRAAKVKSRSDGRSQNYMPPEAQHAVDQAQRTQKTLTTK
jgi:hypothetical protein